MKKILVFGLVALIIALFVGLFLSSSARADMVIRNILHLNKVSVPTFQLTVKTMLGPLPLSLVNVEVEGTKIIAGGKTDPLGKAVFDLPAGIYTVKCYRLNNVFAKTVNLNGNKLEVFILPY
jgi:hypothetical protein